MGPPADGAIAIQCFLLAVLLPMLSLAALAHERTDLIAVLHRSDAVSKRQFAELSGLYRHAPIGLAFLNTKQVYVGINEFLARTHGLSVEEHIGRSVYEILPPSLAQHAEATQKRVIESGEPDINREVSGRRGPDYKEYFCLLVSHYPVRDDAGIIGVSVIVQDITERKQAEEGIHVSHAALAPVWIVIVTSRVG